MLNIEVKPLAGIANSEKDNLSVEYNKEEATITIEDNKLVLSKEAVKALGAVAGDRIAINYWTLDSTTTYPVIAKSEFFSDSTGGNRLTKSNTVSFRGCQRDILKEYGETFQLEPFGRYFKMEKVETSLEYDEFKEEKQDLENLN